MCFPHPPKGQWGRALPRKKASMRRNLAQNLAVSAEIPIFEASNS